MILESADYLDKGFASFLFLAGEIGLEGIEVIGNKSLDEVGKSGV